jgi:hypothetical protein
MTTTQKTIFIICSILLVIALVWAINHNANKSTVRSEINKPLTRTDSIRAKYLKLQIRYQQARLKAPKDSQPILLLRELRAIDSLEMELIN